MDTSGRAQPVLREIVSDSISVEYMCILDVHDSQRLEVNLGY